MRSDTRLPLSDLGNSAVTKTYSEPSSQMIEIAFHLEAGLAVTKRTVCVTFCR